MTADRYVGFSTCTFFWAVDGGDCVRLALEVVLDGCWSICVALCQVGLPCR